MTQASKGAFTQIPVVLLDTCNLPESQQMLFLRFYRELHGGKKGNTWQGSMRKIAKLGRVSTGTAWNFVYDSAIQKSGLFEVKELPNEKNNADSIILHFKFDELWQLNEYYCAGNKVELWKVFPSELIKGVQNLNTPTDDCSNFEQGGVQEMNTSQAQGCSNFEQGVFNSQAQSGVLESNYVENTRNITSRKKEGGAKASPSSAPTTKSNNKIVSFENQKTKRVQSNQPYQVTLSQEEQAVYDLYCTLFHVITNKPPLSEKVKEQCAILAPHVKTQEEINSLDKYARAHTKGHPQKMHLGNLVTNLDGWIVEVKNKKQHNEPSQDTPQQAHHVLPTGEEPPLNETPEQSQARLNKQFTEDFIKLNPVVFWTTTKDLNTIKNAKDQPLEILQTWQNMPVQEAIEKYGLNPRFYCFVPPLKNSLLSRIALLTSRTVSA